MTGNASALDKMLRDFCRDCQPDDVHVIFFSGHGMLLENVDWVVPAGVSRRDAVESANQRVSTDLSTTVRASNTGLVVFVIDACRDLQDVPVTKSAAAAWGDPSRLAIPEEHRFIRFFGCRSGEVSHIVPSGPEGKPVSVFSCAFAEMLRQGTYQSLKDMLPAVQERCRELCQENVLQLQTPRLSYGETSAETEAVLRMPIMRPTAAADAMTVWASFQPERLHCLVVISEHEQYAAPVWGVREMVRDALAGDTGKQIWEAFQKHKQGRRLISGKRRQLSDTFDPAAVSLGCLSVLDALASPEALDRTVQCLVEADLVVFDVTAFEPGIMLLLGIRSACARGVDICSHGDGWKEGKPLGLPFNLQNLNINSHSPRDNTVGADPVVARFVQRVNTGFRQLSRHRHYLDLPAYEDLRQLGSQYEASSTIGVDERVLCLCSYHEGFFSHWQYVQSSLKQVLSTTQLRSPEIARVIDEGTPQLVSQALYEQIRRAAACLIDWSKFSRSAFLELGVRLAVSAWGAVQIVDERYLPGGAEAEELHQITSMQQLFNPIIYQSGSSASRKPFEEAAKALATRNPHLDQDLSYNRVHRVVVQAIGAVHEAHAEVYEELQDTADSLHHPEQTREAVPQILFYGSRDLKRDSERAALERRIAAWFYLHYRMGAGSRADADPLKDSYKKLGRETANGLYDLGGDEDIKLAAGIEQLMDGEG
jgi:hypothetical protein